MKYSIIPPSAPMFHINFQKQNYVIWLFIFRLDRQSRMCDQYSLGTQELARVSEDTQKSELEKFS